MIRKVQAEYRLPEKARTIGEMLAEARQKSGAQKLSGHDIMALERFDPATRHMIVFDVLTHDSPVGWKGEKMRLFLTDAGYSKALENQEKGTSKSAIMRRCFPAISTMTIKTVRGSRPKMYQNQRKIFCFFLCGLRSGQDVDVFPMREATEAYRRINHSKSTLFIITERRCEDGCFSY